MSRSFQRARSSIERTPAESSARNAGPDRPLGNAVRLGCVSGMQFTVGYAWRYVPELSLSRKGCNGQAPDAEKSPAGLCRLQHFVRRAGVSDPERDQIQRPNKDPSAVQTDSRIRTIATNSDDLK